MNASASAAAAGNRPKFLKKITPKTITDETGVKITDREWVALNLKAPLPLYDLFGVINRTKTGHTDKGDWLAFVGRFQAVSPDGEVFDSGKAHIPVLEDVIYSALTEAQESNPKAAVHIAVRIGIKPAPKDKPSATGYEYWAERLVDAQSEDDPIARLRAEAARPMLAGSAAASTTSEAGKTSEGGNGKKAHHGK
jgi:hypothetical protein